MTLSFNRLHYLATVNVNKYWTGVTVWSLYIHIYTENCNRWWCVYQSIFILVYHGRDTKKKSWTHLTWPKMSSCKANVSIWRIRTFLMDHQTIMANGTRPRVCYMEMPISVPMFYDNWKYLKLNIERKLT